MVSEDGSEQCICDAGFEGDQCETELPCDTQCNNGGVCTFEEAWWLTEMGFFENIDEFYNSYNHTDVIGRGFTYCECPEGQLGAFCEITCDSDCGENGECVFLGQDTNTGCLCKEGFSGDSCQFPCSLDCQNDGLCVSDGVSEYCECQSLWEGM